jgi:hypothetical protein
MKYYSFLLVFTLLTGSAFSQKAKTVFNGKDLTGWTVHGTEKWYVDKKELVCESGPDKKYGYLSTDAMYKDFVLDLDFKQEANGNSGVFIRSSITGVDINGWQVEVAPLNLHTGGIYESMPGGRQWLIQPKKEDEAALKTGKWNHLRIEAVGNKVTSWLNGKQMVTLQDEKIGSRNGFIALQIHSGGGIKVRWKNIKIREVTQ